MVHDWGRFWLRPDLVVYFGLDNRTLAVLVDLVHQPLGSSWAETGNSNRSFFSLLLDMSWDL